MFERLSLGFEALARFIIPMGFFTLLAVAAILTLVVPPLGYYLVRFLGFAISFSVRFLGFVFSWQPKELVGAPRNRLFPDSSTIPELDAKEDHETPSACNRRNA